ncbi:contains similarity to A. thaliana zinc finger protein (PID:g976277) [Arabidopsis thaliana]|uniref:F2P16.1 protein n=1 Tax=Arabidopsis thaliana TaxID=3702 RepID=O04627_ARATH|nr:contains similarity to A. thaliana zinc finger protein (PID:g976277) [Arabidopsis thaliana]
MADNLIRVVQDINLGVDDASVTIPEAMVAQAAVDNRFILLGRPVMPRRQNLRSIVASMPRVWGQSGLVHGRLIPGNQFQFIFPSEESLEMVVRRGPGAFNDRMLILQRWTPMANAPPLNTIPFWIQIRGIPYQFLSRDVIEAIGRAIGDVMDVDYDVEAVARVEFVQGPPNQAMVIREIGPEEKNSDAEEIIPVVNAPEDAEDAEVLSDIDRDHNAMDDYADYQEVGVHTACTVERWILMSCSIPSPFLRMLRATYQTMKVTRGTRMYFIQVMKLWSRLFAIRKRWQ